MAREQTIRYTCDRCGEFHNIDKVSAAAAWHEIELKPMPQFVPQFSDICPACFEDFKVWWDISKRN